MKEGFRQCMAWLHTWTGLCVGWVLYFIFVTGTVGYFTTEVDRWMRPELPVRSVELAPAQSLALAEARLRERAPDADAWTITLPGGRNSPHLAVSWRDPPKPGEPQGSGRGRGRFAGPSEILDTTGEPIAHPAARATGGGFLLYRMHWRLHYLPSTLAYWIVGLCSMIMFVAILTGIVTHKKIFKDFFTFRPAKGQRSWLDFHNVVSVTSLPFFLMITYSGLLFFMYEYMPIAPRLLLDAAQVERRFEPPPPLVRGERVAMASLTDVLARAESTLGRDQVERITISLPDDANSRITVSPRATGHEYLAGAQQISFDGATGEPVENAVQGGRGGARAAGFASKSVAAMFALHEGVFADYFVRWVYFIAGVLGCAMIATGLVLWTVKRRPQRAKDGRFGFGHGLVERLNVGTVVGLLIGIAVYFWANRLVPSAWAARNEWEVNAMFAAWVLMFIHCSVRPVQRAWIEQLWLAMVLFTVLPLLNALTTQRHLGVSLVNGDWALAGFDLSCFAIGGLLAVAAVRVARRAAQPVATKAKSRAVREKAPATPQVEVVS